MGEQFTGSIPQVTQADPDLPERFRTAMSRMATPVSVVTSDGQSGRIGLTVSAISLVSMAPPVVLACIGRRSPANQVIQDNDAFRVNILGHGHDHVADTFAGRPWPGKEKWDFSCGDWDLDATCGPRLTDAVVSIACRLHSALTIGSHVVYLGEAQAASEADQSPLLYLQGTYCQPVPEPPSTFPDYPDARPVHDQRRKSQ